MENRTQGGRSATRQGPFEYVVDQLQTLVCNGGYSVGEKLPSEKELCERYEVSRTVLREALRAVEAKGIISIYAGKGIFVAEPNFENLISPMEYFISAGKVDVMDIIQARHFLEPGIAHVAAIRADAEDIQKMEENLNDMVVHLETGDLFMAADRQFHANLAQATKNSVLYVLARTITESLVLFRKTIYESEGAPAKAVRRHQQILAAVRAHEPQLAYQAMESHILDGEEYQHIRLMQQSLNKLAF